MSLEITSVSRERPSQVDCMKPRAMKPHSEEYALRVAVPASGGTF